jgi:acylglycerol lipase
MNSYTHNTGTFIGKSGTEIFFQNWCVDRPRGFLVIVHGLGEHSGRYDNITNELKGKNISIYALDHRGHGRSGGKRGHIDSFMDYVYDLKLFIDLIKEENSEIPLVMLGHSLGGVIATKYALAYSEDLNALVLSSPGFVPLVEIPGWKKSLSKIGSRYAPGLSQPSNLDARYLSHDADVVEAYENDRLVHDRVTTRFFSEFSKACEECMHGASDLRMPLLVFHGTDDKIVDYRGSEKLFTCASSRDKNLHLFNGYYHETMNEVGKKKVLQIAARWIVNAISGKKISKGAKTNRQEKPIKRIVTKSVQKSRAYSFQKGSPKKGAKKTIKKGVKKIVGTKKSAKKSTKKSAKKSSKKSSKKKK